MPRSHPKLLESEIALSLSRDDLKTLAAISHFYEKSMGPMRHVVAFTTARGMRKRLRFIHDESVWLERFVSEEAARLDGSDEISRQIAFTPRAAIAFWGRLLASLNSKRSRRKLSEAEKQHRQELINTFLDAIAGFARKHRDIVEREIATRRTIEQVWMREAIR